LNTGSIVVQDALDAQDMRRAEFFRKGKHTESVFGKRKREPRDSGRGKRRKDYWNDEAEDERIGSFETHSRGVASEIMKKYVKGPVQYPPPPPGPVGRLGEGWGSRGERAPPPQS
jgi:hypothetical protein